MAVRFNKLRIRNTFSYVNVYYAATLLELQGIADVEDNAFGLVGPSGFEIPYIYDNGAWSASAGSHGSNHQNGGSDEISVAGLSGLLADAQTALAHASSHAALGADPLTLTQAQITGLVTDLAAKVASTRSIISGGGLTGGGDLSNDRTLAVGAGAGIEVTADAVAVGFLDTDVSHRLRIACGSDLTADKTLTITTGDSDRTITLTGNPTLADWFDQSVKVAATPTFGATTVTGPLTISGASAGQIVFPATPNPSANANTLDDYKEGTWVPVIGGDGGTSGQTYTVQAGHYIKIGRQVHISFQATLSAKGTITGNVTIQGLPYAVQFDDNAPTIVWSGTVTSFVNVQGQAVAGQSQIYVLVATAAATGQSVIATADIGNTTSFIGRMTYTTA